MYDMIAMEDQGRNLVSFQAAKKMQPEKRRFSLVLCVTRKSINQKRFYGKSLGIRLEQCIIQTLCFFCILYKSSALIFYQ